MESNVETKDKNTLRKISYTEIVIHGNKRRHNVGTEISHNHQYKNDDVPPNLCISYGNVSTWSLCKPSDIWDAVTT